VALRTPAADAHAGRAVGEAIAAMSVPAVREPLAALLHLSPKGTGRIDAPSLGRIDLATFARAPSDTNQAPASVGVAWTVTQGDLDVAVAEDAVATLAAEVSPPARVGQDLAAAAAVRALGSDVTFAAIVPRSASAAAGGPSLLFAWGRRGEDGWARLSVEGALVRDLARRYAGL
jgi:hypothetical protein